MPYPSEHSARINDPSKYKKIRRENDKFGSGIDVIWGIKDDGKTEVQAIRFDKNKFSVSEARKWLKDHDYTVLEFEPASEKSINSRMQYKTFPFKILETKENYTDKFNGSEQYGIIKGYASTYGNIDKCNDIILEGAFTDSIQDYKNKNRHIKVYLQHNTLDMPIGGISSDNIDSDKTGLPVCIDINKEVQKGREVYALAKQGVLSDLSIGYTVDDFEYNKDGVRLLKKLFVWEVSIVGEPANDRATIAEVKKDLKQLFFTVNDVEKITTKKEFEHALRDSGAFSKEAAVVLAAKFIEKSRSESVDLLNKINELKNLINII